MSKFPALTIVLPVYNEEENIEKKSVFKKQKQKQKDEQLTGQSSI